jgi:hypothetical protein
MNARMACLTGALAASLAAMAGCGGTGPAREQASAPAATPRDALLAAVPAASVGAYHFTIKGGTQPMTGVLDAPHKTLRIQVRQHDADAGFSLSMTFLVVDKRSWTKISFEPADTPGLPKVPKTWMLLDPGKVKDPENSPLEYGDEADPGSITAIVQAADGVKEVTPRHYAGTTDLTRSTDAGIVEERTLSALGERAKAVPFEAVVDGQGHVTSAVVKIPAAGKVKASTYSVTYDGYGTTATPGVPAAGEQQKAVDVVYQMLNG